MKNLQQLKTMTLFPDIVCIISVPSCPRGTINDETQLLLQTPYATYGQRGFFPSVKHFLPVSPKENRHLVWGRVRVTVIAVSLRVTDSVRRVTNDACVIKSLSTYIQNPPCLNCPLLCPHCKLYCTG